MDLKIQRHKPLIFVREKAANYDEEKSTKKTVTIWTVTVNLILFIRI